MYPRASCTLLVDGLGVMLPIQWEGTTYLSWMTLGLWFLQTAIAAGLLGSFDANTGDAQTGWGNIACSLGQFAL